VQERYGYNAFGTSRVMNASFVVQSSSSYNWETRFAAYRWDSESGLYQVRYRYYHPLLGTWINRDPIGERSGNNLYQYCYSDPINNIDSDGEIPLVTGAIGAGIGALLGAGFAWGKGGSWSDIGYGALRGGIGGGVGGLTLGFGGAALAGAFGGGISGGAFAGAFATGAGELAAQGLDNATGRRCGFYLYDFLESFMVGGIFGGVLLRPYTASQQPVTSWAESSVPPDLNPGRWVMTGGPSVGNYLRTVGPAVRGYPYGNSASGTVSGNSLAYPPGATGNLAGQLGQRIFVP
jgi:RHS repeat-associated protein